MGRSVEDDTGGLNTILSRRRFLRGASLIGATALASELLHTGETEYLQTYPTGIASSDLGVRNVAEAWLYGISQPFPADNTGLEDRLLGQWQVPEYELVEAALSGYVSDAVYDFPDAIKRTKVQHAEELFQKASKRDTLSTLLWSIMQKFTPHARELLEHKNHVLRYLGFVADDHFVIPVQSNISGETNDQDGGITVRDEEENPGLRMFFAADGITTNFQTYARKASIVAMPHQVGACDAYFLSHNAYKGDFVEDAIMSQIKIVGAYSEERAYESLSGLADMANKLKVPVIGALGNSPYEFVSPAIKKLKKQGKWREDLIMLAAEAMWHMNMVQDPKTGQMIETWSCESQYGGYGDPDDVIYINNAENKKQYIRSQDMLPRRIGYGSSAAVWTTALFADLLRYFRKVPPNKLKEKIYSSGKIEKDSLGRELNVIHNLDVIKNALN